MRMELGLSQHQTIKQIQTLSPQMYMSMEILCLNSLDLEDRIDTELENNETLELAEPQTSTESTESPGPGEGEGTEQGETSEGGADAESFDQRVEQWDNYSREEYATVRKASSYSGERDDKLDALSNTEGRPTSLQEHLEEQVHLLDDDEILLLTRLVDTGLVDKGTEVAGEPQEAAPGVTEEPSPEGAAAGGTPTQVLDRIRDICTDIIYNIDNRGYLMYSLEEIQASLEESPPLELLEKALGVIQRLDPPGIGGRDLEECLLLQLRRDKQQYPLEEEIIRHHLKDLGHNRLPKIAKALGATLEDIKTAVENIASLNPIPGKLFGGESSPFIRPDVTVEEVEGRYEVRVDSGYLPRLRVSSHYRDLYKASKSNPDVKKYLKKKMDSAEWLLAAIRQRQSTLQRIAQETVHVQSAFFDHGISHLKPLKMVDIAERVGVHVSTISRAISGKYMQTPRGILSMKSFFTGGASRSDGTTESRGSVIQRIKTLIDGEDKASPLSDIDIVRRLAESNIKISRRTVTKYREAEGIASSRERRTY
jgi:RNA polymerase sigma-54 factor